MNQKYKILLFVPSPKSQGGIGHYFEKILPHFSSDVTYFIRGVRNQQSRLSRLLFPLTQIYDIVRLIFHLLFRNYDLLHFNTSFGLTGIYRDAFFISIAKFLGENYIVFFRGIDNAVIKKIEKKHWNLFRKTFLEASSIWVLSEELKARIIEWGYKKTLICETTMVDSSLLKTFSIKDKIQQFREAKNIEILFLSRIEKTKGIYEAIDAFRIVRNQHNNILLRICGNGNAVEEVLKYIGADLNKDIFYTGYVSGDKKVHVLKKAHIFLFPSYREGMPNALLEALAFGLPVITSKVGGVPDFFTKDMGFMIESIQPKNISKFLSKLIEDRERCISMAKYNFNYAKDVFYSDIVAKRIESYYDKLIHD